MATPEQTAKILVLRGLGYQLEEIGNEVGLSVSAVSYQLKQQKKIAGESPEEAVKHLKDTISTFIQRKPYDGIPSGTRYVVTHKGVFLRLPITGERLPVPDTDELKKLFLKFRGPGRVRITDKGEILAYWNDDNPEEDFDPEDDDPDPKAFTHWFVIGTIDPHDDTCKCGHCEDHLSGKIPCVPELPNDPSLYEPGDIWRGPVDGMKYSVGGKYIFRSHPRYGPRWRTEFKTKSGGLSKDVRLAFLDYRGTSGGRLYITESNAVITYVVPEDLEMDFETVMADLNDKQKQYLLQRLEGTDGKVPIFLGVHEGGIELEPMPSIHDALTTGQIHALSQIFGGGEEE